MKKIYTYKTKAGASQLMSKVLRFPEQVDNRMDEKICRITVTSYTIVDNIKPAYHKQYKNEHLYQIELRDVSDKEFLVLESQLDNLDDVVVVDK